MKIDPPNKEKYLNRCYMGAGMCRNADVIPAHMIAGSCRMVLQHAFGSHERVIVWMLMKLAELYWRRIRHEVFWTWHLYIRQRTEEEVQELLHRDIEKHTGLDMRDWPDVIEDEVEEES